MTISAVVDIVHGELLNTPAINRIESIRIDARKVKRGDLYIPLFGNDLETAIENGAYAVILPKNSLPLDNETAWIAVDDANQSLLLLLRFLLVEKEIAFYHLDEPLFALASAMLGRNKEVVLIEGSIANYVEALVEKEEIRFCISNDRATLNMLASTVATVAPASVTAESSGESLFLSKINHKGMRYQFGVAGRLKPYLEQLTEFCVDHSLAFEMETRASRGLFDTFYLNTQNRIVARPTGRVLVIDYPYSDGYIDESITYLRQYFRWARVLFLSDRPHAETILFESYEALQKVLSSSSFDIVYVMTQEPQRIGRLFEEPGALKPESALF